MTREDFVRKIRAAQKAKREGESIVSKGKAMISKANDELALLKMEFEFHSLEFSNARPQPTPSTETKNEIDPDSEIGVFIHKHRDRMERDYIEFLTLPIPITPAVIEEKLGISEQVVRRRLNGKCKSGIVYRTGKGDRPRSRIVDPISVIEFLAGIVEPLKKNGKSQT